ncbi:MAG: zinc metallopeptidase [Pirellulales bacterium]|nr:zinc metallopeptidase [Pirellulales bacterium]
MFYGMGYFELLLWTSPALILMLWAQMRVKSAFAAAQEVPAQLSGAAAARHILDAAGLQNVGIEQVPGQLSDHYDPRAKVLRLSQAVYGSRSTAAVGIAAHEAGHALQDAKNYAPLVVRNAAVPAATFGGNVSFLMIFVGILMSAQPLILFGIAAFACVVFFQLVNLPVEFDASARAKQLLVSHGIVAEHDMVYVNRVLNAAAWTYVAGTLQAVLTLLYYVMRYASRD